MKYIIKYLFNKSRHYTNIKYYLCVKKVRRCNMTIVKTVKTRAERRAEAIKKITASKESAKSFLQKAGIVNKSGTLSKVYK